MITQEEVKRLNKKVEIPILLTFLKAPISNLKKANNNMTDWRINCWWRDGDNPQGCGITFDFGRQKWLVTDFTGRTFGNIDLIDFMTKFLKIPFRQAIDHLTFACGKENGFETIENMELSGFTPKPKLEHPVPIDRNVLDTFNSGTLHQYWKGRGFDHTTAQYFGLGYCNYGFLKDRLTIPVLDEKGRLVSVQGRASNDDLEPKYLFGSSEQGESAKLTLYNFYFAWKAARERGWVGIVESANSVWRAKQYGYDNFMATLSASMTERQAKLLMVLGVNVVLMYDHDENQTMAGQIGTIKAANMLVERKLETWIARIGFNADPADLTSQQFQMTLKNAIIYQGGK
jgi:DNA primase